MLGNHFCDWVKTQCYIRRKISAMIYDKPSIQNFQKKILRWYEENGRSFPWRKPDASNYEKIISEVLLQRTKAKFVARFFPIFLSKYPSWESLAESTVEELEETLTAIGMQKQKAQRLFQLAQDLKTKKGIFPKERSQVEEMPGMGQYITNAYELFILKKPAPLLDVNMVRLLERIYGERKLTDIRRDPELQELAKAIVVHPRSIEINWAILDYGAMICKALKPKCGDCIFREECNWFSKNILLE